MSEVCWQIFIAVDYFWGVNIMFPQQQHLIGLYAQVSVVGDY